MNTTDTWMMGGGLPKAVRMIGEGQFLNWEELMAGMTSGAAMTSTALAYSSAVWAYRCANMRALTIGGLPWHVLRGENEVEWPLAPALGKILDDIEMALCLWGASYVLKQANRVKVLGLQWLNPGTMQVIAGPAGIARFEQKLDGQTTPTVFQPEQIIYHRLFNPSDDLGPGIAPMQVALSAAGLAKNANTFAEKFFEHGAVPLVLFTTDQALPKGEAERVKSWWDRTFGGVMNAWRSGILGNGLKPTTIQPPVKDLALTELLGQTRQQIAVAFGIPQTMLEDAANFATAREHKLSFYYETIFPEARLIMAGLNEQLFEPQGLEFEFQFEAVEAVQQDEATKSLAIMGQFQAGLIEDWEARQMLGYSPIPDPPPEVLAAIEQRKAEQAEREAAAAEKARADAEASPDQAPTEEVEPEEEEPPAPPERGLSKEALQDLAKWRRKAQKGRYAFESAAIPSWLMAAVNVRLMRDDLRERAFDPALRKFSRETAETRLARKLTTNYAQSFDDIVHALDIGKVPKAVIEGLGKNIGATLATELAIVIADALLSQSVEFGTPLQDYEGTVNDAAKWAEKYAFDEVKGIEDTQVETLEDVIKRLANGEIDHDAAVASLEDTFGKARAEMIATTEVTRANAESVHIYKSELADRGVKTVERWLTAEDELVCEEICQGLDHSTEDIWSKAVPGGPPAHPRCILPGNVVAVPGLSAGAESFYVGRAIEITCQSGRKLTVTENHPVLTSRGWIAAQRLHEGEDIITCANVERIASSVNPDYDHVPAIVEQVFGALKVARGMATARVPTAAEDLHGDGRFVNGNVNVVYPDGALLPYLQARLTQLRSEQVLDRGGLQQAALNRLGVQLQFLDRTDAPSGSGMGVGGQGLAFLGRHASHAQGVGFANSTALDTGIAEDAREGAARDSVLLRQFLLWRASDIGSDNIISIRQFDFSGHVYDLQSDLYGLYTCNGVLVKNCRCQLSLERAD